MEMVQDKQPLIVHKQDKTGVHAETMDGKDGFTQSMKEQNR